jgi:hypothetical protein
VTQEALLENAPVAYPRLASSSASVVDSGVMLRVGQSPPCSCGYRPVRIVACVGSDQEDDDQAFS